MPGKYHAATWWPLLCWWLCTTDGYLPDGYWSFEMNLFRLTLLPTEHPTAFSTHCRSWPIITHWLIAVNYILVVLQPTKFIFSFTLSYQKKTALNKKPITVKWLTEDAGRDDSCQSSSNLASPAWRNFQYRDSSFLIEKHMHEKLRFMMLSCAFHMTLARGNYLRSVLWCHHLAPMPWHLPVSL